VQLEEKSSPENHATFKHSKKVILMSVERLNCLFCDYR